MHGAALKQTQTENQVSILLKIILYDSDFDNVDRSFLFGTQKNVEYLEEANIYADGTFYIASELFEHKALTDNDI